jgi:short-subunit dehydrogenase
MADPSNLPETFYTTKPIDFSKSVDTSNLKDKSILITGGANGLGLGCAKAFAEAG